MARELLRELLQPGPPTPSSLPDRTLPPSPIKANAAGIFALQAIFELYAKKLKAEIDPDELLDLPTKLQATGIEDSATLIRLTRDEATQLFRECGLVDASADLLATELPLDEPRAVIVQPGTSLDAFLVSLDSLLEGAATQLGEVKMVDELRGLTAGKLQPLCRSLLPAQRIVFVPRVAKALKS